MNMTYLIAITVGLCVTYVTLLNVLPLFFGKKQSALQYGSYKSIVGIITLSLLGYGLTLSIDDPELANRFLHAYGGGFMAFFTCFCAARDAHRGITRLQLCIFAFLVVGMLGIMNEIIEYVLHVYGHIVFVEDMFDTSLDLISNTIGSIVALILFAPIHGRTFWNR
jgi:hypothetical protein